MNTKKLFIYGMLLLASILLVVITSCEKEDDDSILSDENGGFEYGEMTDPRDGRTYKTVEIGDQVWMAENLAYLPEITYEDDWGSSTEPQFAVHSYEPGSGVENVEDAKSREHYKNYGVLYNWAAAMDGAVSSKENPSGVQGICPPGWHLPSDAEWTELVEYVVAQGYPDVSSNPEGAGNALKSCRQEESPHGENCNTSEHPRWDSQGTHSGFNEFGFSALPAGSRFQTGTFYSNVGSRGHWWSSTETGNYYAWARHISNAFGNVDRPGNSFSKGQGVSVRCIKDD